MISHIAFEGERGTGKTSTIQALREILATRGIQSSLNRELETGKKDSPYHLQSLVAHEAWLAQFDTQGNPIDSIQAEALSRAKFQHTLAELRRETAIVAQLNPREPFISDRDIDTTVLYAATELILSNPNYSLTSDEIASLYQQVLQIRPPADLTFCLVSNHPQQTLQRSFLAKHSTEVAFPLSAIQKRSQETASKNLPRVIATRQQLSPAQVITINTDGKRPDEIAKLTANYIMREPILHPRKLNFPVSPLFASPEQLQSLTLDQLAHLIFQSTAGSAFPSSEEVQLGFNNCVYSSLSLIAWSQTLGIREPQLIAITHDPITRTNPVHWACLDRDQSQARIIDAAPFNPAVKFEQSLTLSPTPEGYRLPTTNGTSYTEVSPPTPAKFINSCNLPIYPKLNHRH